MKKCTNPICKNLTLNPKYCSKSCAATHINKILPKRKTKKKCIICGKPVKSYRHNRCSTHFEEYIKHKAEHKYQEKTIGEYRELLSVKDKHPSWLHSHIRLFNKSWNKELINLPCACCGYNLHVELCHIKPVASFPDNALLKDVNSKENVVQLCPNCHWELDNGFLEVKFVKGIPKFKDLLLNAVKINTINFDDIF